MAAPKQQKGAREQMTPLQEAFVLEYVIDLNATKAALRAGYSPKSASRSGSLLINTPKIKKALKKANKARFAKLDTARQAGDRVIEELVTLAYSRIDDYVGTDFLDRKFVKDLDDMKNIQAVKKIKINADGTSEVDLWSKTKALDALGKHYHLFNAAQKIEITTKAAMDLTKLDTAELEQLAVLQKKMEK